MINSDYDAYFLKLQENKNRILRAAIEYFKFQNTLKVDISIKGDSLDIGEYVLLSKPEDTMNSNKLDPPKDGPYRVVGKNGSSYTISDDVLNKEKTVHISRLTRFIGKNNNQRSVLLKRRKRYDVEKIITHRDGDLKDLSSKKYITFLTKWDGYGFEFNTWESYDNLKYNIKLHEYLRELGYKNWIPKNFRD